MRQKSIVIRVQRDASFDHAGPSLASAVGQSGFQPFVPQIDIDEFTPAEAARASQDSDVLAIAPDVPTVLVEPRENVEGEFEIETDRNGSTWGVEAVGATTSPLNGDGINVAV